jgi:class 3 adenylate cyclase
MAVTGHVNVMFAADMAGDPNLSGPERTGTLERLQAHCQQLVHPKIAEHNGYIVNLIGNGLLVEFSSPIQAVQCAVEVQRGMINQKTSMTPDRRIMFRVGIAEAADLVSRAVAALPAGERATLIKRGTGIRSNGGNLAARIGALADSAGICISSEVWEAIRGQLPHRFADIGERSLGIGASPVRCYAMSAAAVAASQRVAPRHRSSSASQRMWLQSAAVAASTLAVVGVCSVALWGWRGANTSTAPIAAPARVVSHPSVVGNEADGGSQARPVPQSPNESIAAANRQSQELSPPQPSLATIAADRRMEAASGRSALSEVGAAVVRGKQAPSAPQTTPDNSPVVLRGIATPSALHAAADATAAIVRGK